MKWNDMEKPWQVCFELGWESMKKGSVPIGAVITNEKGEIVSKGRNMLYEDSNDPEVIAWHKISHAEMNAMIKVRGFDHPNIRKYTIYTTTEPCPMCFGTIVMVNIRNIRFAARDRYAGATRLNDASDYIKSKNINITGPYKGLEEVQIAIHTAYEIKRYINHEILLNAWRIESPAAVDVGTYLARHDIIKKLVNDNEKAAAVFDMVSGMLNGKE
ncbi:MAG: nucleoside deaminase [Clostridiaceae bacterium]|jgi:tRNA(adenine34) deaminase|nr:nucleoside deaminase [Clostridiaceae bacterium]